jgi:YVTN family beta-propeller protein
MERDVEAKGRRIPTTRAGLTPALTAVSAVALRLSIQAVVIFAALACGNAVYAQTPSFTVSTYANTFTPFGGNQTTLAQPTGVAADANGNIYIADTGDCVVWEFPVSGAEPFVLAGEPGNCAGSYSSATPTLDSLNHPVDVAVCNGTVYIADTSSSTNTGLHTVTGGAFKNVAINFTLTNGLRGAVQPQAIACDSAGDLFVQSSYDSADMNGPVWTLDTLSAAGVSMNIDTEFDEEYQGVAVDASGNAYTVRGAFNQPQLQNIAKFTFTTTPINGFQSSSQWVLSLLQQSRTLVGPTRLAIDSNGNFYATEAPPSSIVVTPPVLVTEISPTSGGAYSVATIAGNGSAGFSGDGGPALLAELSNANGIAIAPTGILVADTSNNRVRKLFTEPAMLANSDKIPDFSLIAAVNPVTKKLYVPVSKGTTTNGGQISDIVVYSTADDTVVANIPGASVSYLAVDAVNNFIYASSSQNGTVEVIDGVTDSINATITVGKSPLGIAVDPGINTAYVSNSDDTTISAIRGPVRISGGNTITTSAVLLQNISADLPLGAIAVDTKIHSVYAIVAGPANIGSENYALAIIDGVALTVTNTVSYLNNAGFTDIGANALAVDQRSGLVVIADTEDQAVHIYNPKTGQFQGFTENFFPTTVVVDSVNEIAYASTGYGSISEINLEGGAQSAVNTPSFSATSAENCGFSGTAVAVDPSTDQAYFTTCDGTNGAALNLWDGASQKLTTTFALGSPISSLNSVSGDFAVVVNPATHIAYVSNSTPNTTEIDIFNGPTPGARPLLSISPLTFNFESVAVGQSSLPETFTVMNGGTAPAIVPPPTIIGTGGFSNSGGSYTASASTGVGDSCSAMIVFAPTLNQSVNGGLEFLDNAPDTPQLVSLSGTGTGNHTLTISPAFIPTAYIGLFYPPSGSNLNFTSPNATNGSSINICATLPSGQPNTAVCCPPGSESLGPPCPAGLLPAGLNWMEPELVGTPSAGSAGSYPFTVVATDGSGDTGSQNYVLVVDPAFSATLALNPSTVTGGTASTATVTLNEPVFAGAFILLVGSNSTVVPATGITASAGQVTIPIPLPTTAVTQTQTVTIFASLSGGVLATATLTVTPPAGPPAPVSIVVPETITVSDAPSFSDIADSEAIAVHDSVTVTPLINIGAPVAFFSPSTIGFGSVSPAGAATQTITVSNIGQGQTALLLTGARLSTASSAFTLGPIVCSNGSSSFPITIPSGQACAVTVSYTAPPSSGQPLSATLVFADSAAQSNLATTGSGSNFSQSLTINSSGVSSTAPPPSATVTIPTITEMITVTDNPLFSDVADSETITVTDIVTVIPFTPLIKVGPSSINPFTLTVGTGTYLVNVTLTNGGNVAIGELTLLKASLGGLGALTFPAGTTLSNLAPGASATFTANFSNSAGAAGKGVPLSLSGSYTAGTLSGNWSVSFRSVTLP